MTSAGRMPPPGPLPVGSAVSDALTGLADDELLTGHVLTSVAGWGPELEINIALSSMGQDEIGHARRLYALGDSEGEVDRMVYERPPAEFRASVLARTYPAEWELLLARQFLYETAGAARAAVLAGSCVDDLALLVAEMEHEERYHLDFWHTWLRTTTARSAGARDRVQRALDQMWPLATVSFLPERPGAVEEALGLPDGALQRARDEWISATHAACGQLGLRLCEGTPDPGLDRLDAMLSEMRYVYRTAPGRW
ncbi:MAG TPA: Phenylacetic acid catabolic protein [Streptosporangiaceae bacterium]|nr:Phenylacetic acid catabolic protein [Streptosporangiaceae bacterium]